MAAQGLSHNQGLVEQSGGAEEAHITNRVMKNTTAKSSKNLSAMKYANDFWLSAEIYRNLRSRSNACVMCWPRLGMRQGA
jgi:hypothetical protein